MIFCGISDNASEKRLVMKCELYQAFENLNKGVRQHEPNKKMLLTDTAVALTIHSLRKIRSSRPGVKSTGASRRIHLNGKAISVKSSRKNRLLLTFL